MVSPTTLHLGLVHATLRKDIAVSAQNVSKYGAGAYTGEVSAPQLREFGVGATLIGHSERRHLLKESDDDVKLKVAAALKAGLVVMACVGELLSERKAGQTMDVVQRQLTAIRDGVLSAVTDPQSAVFHGTAKQTVTDALTAVWATAVQVAYEPVWAIGTGVVATPAEAQTVHSGIRAWLAANALPATTTGTANAAEGAALAAGVRILYGGSVSRASCDVLIVEADIDGFLVGGASLVADDFAWICNAPLRQCAKKAKSTPTTATAAAAPAK